MNFFSSEPYLAAVAGAFYPGRPYTIELVRVAGRCFKVLRVDGQVVDWVPFLDMLEPVSHSDSARPHGFLRQCSHGSVSTAEWFNRGLHAHYACAPFIDWSQFDTWAEFVAHSKAQRTSGFRTNLLKAKKKLDEQGAVFSVHDTGPDVMATVMRWKSAQYTGSGYLDIFKSKPLVRKFELLHERGLLTNSTLRSKDGTLMAGHVGMLHDGRWYYWLPAYDVAFAQLSVGAVLLLHMFEHAFAQKHREFDFLLGDEPYKWSYATHSRLVAPAGLAPLRERVWKPLRGKLMQQVRQHADVYARLQAAKRRVEQWRL